MLDYKSGSTRNFNQAGLGRFDYFWAKLKERGIYLHIDLIVARAFQEGDGLDYPGQPGSCLKCYTMVNRRLIELQKEYAQKLLCHVNPYTGTRLLDDPAVMTIQINNEDSAIKGTADVKDLPGWPLQERAAGEVRPFPAGEIRQPGKAAEGLDL